MTHSAESEINALVEQIAKLEAVQSAKKAQNKLKYCYPDTGEYARSKYPKHVEFFHRRTNQAAFIAGNRVGKTFAGAYEMALHLTGQYPFWWRGRKWKKPIHAWAAGLTNEGTRDIIQKELLGKCGVKSADGGKGVTGTGMIPLDCIGKITWKQGIADFADVVLVKHKSGGWSTLGFKTYGQGRESFQGTALDLIWFDEEPPASVFEEAITRTATTEGAIYITFTPLLGISDVIKTFLVDNQIVEGNVNGKTVVNMTWDDAPHLTEKMKDELLGSYSPHMRDARSKGIPSLGAGAIYPLCEADILVDPFKIPNHWPKFYGMDVGWNMTAAVWGAWDEQADIIYIYSEYYRGQAEPTIHASGIRSRGEWIMGAIDPASRGKSQIDGRDLFQFYGELGLRLTPARNSVESGIYQVWERLSTGRLKIFRGLNNLMSEYRVYRRDTDGKIVKEFDHLMDSLRYCIVTGFDVKRVNPALLMEAREISMGHNKDGMMYSEFRPF